jgi:two-component system cell cycle response regulator
MPDADSGSDRARIAALEAALAAERAAREAAERALAGSEGRLRDVARREQEAIVRIARLSVGHGNVNLEDMLGELTAIAAVTLGVERSSVWLLSEDHTSLCCLDLYERTPARHSAGILLAAAQYPRYFEALETGRAIDAHDALSDPRTSEFRDGYLAPLGISSMMDAAIRREGRLVGVVCHEHVGVPRVWQLDELEFAGALADQVALVLEADERRRLEEESEKTRRQLREAQELARRDELTHLYNRRAMEDMLADEAARAMRYRRPLSVMMIDFDHFKEINDRHGHRAGDDVLREAALLVVAELRANDKATRYGGEEFCLILPEAGADEAAALAERLRRALEGHVFRVARDGGAVDLRVTASIGVASLGEHAGSAERLVRAADRALYEAKAAGRNRVVRATADAATAGA